MASKPLEFEATVNAGRINNLLAQLRTDAEGAAKAINDAFGGEVKKRIVFQEVADTKGVKRLVAVEKERLTVADQIINRQEQLDRVQRGSLTSLRQQVNTFRQQRDGVVRYADSVGKIGGLVRQQTDEWIEANAKLSQVTRQLALAEASGFWQQIKVATRAQGFINLLNGIQQIVQGLQAASIVIGQFQAAINGVINSAAEVQSFALTFKAIGIGAAGGSAALQEASRIALGLGSDLNTVQEGFKQLSPVVLNIGGNMGDVSAITETLSSRFAAFGISGDRARRVMNGVIQAFAKGKLQAEELTQQISEADPAFKTDFAGALFKARGELGDLGKSIDGSVANLEKLVKAGKITGDVLLKVLPGLSKSSLLFGKLGPTAGSALEALARGNVTIDQVRSNIKSINQLSLRNFAESAQPLINAFIRIQAVTADFFARFSRSEGAKALARLGATAFDIFANLADSLLVVAEGVTAIVGALKPLIDLFTAFPPLLQTIGLLTIGNLVKPLGLFERRIEKTRAAWAGFTGFFRNALIPAQKDTSVISQKIGDIGNTLSETLGRSAKPIAITSIVSQAEKAVESIDNLGSKTTNTVDSKIKELESKISRLNAKLTPKTDAASDSTVEDNSIAEANLTALIARNEERIKEQQKRAATIRSNIASATKKVTIDVDELGEKIDENVSKLSKFGNISQKALDFKPLTSAEKKAPPPYSGFSESALKNYAKRITEQIAATEEAIASGSIEALGAISNEDLSGKTQKQIDDFLNRFVAVQNSTKTTLIELQNEFQKRNIDFSIDIIGDEKVNNRLESIQALINSLENEAQIARAELASLAKVGSSDTGKNGFSDKEAKRQAKLREQIKKSSSELQDLYAQQAKQANANIQARRQQVGFIPGSTDGLQRLIEIQKEADREQFRKNFMPKGIAQDRQKIYDELAQIDKNRVRDMATFGEQAYPGGYRTKDIDELIQKLQSLDEVQNNIEVGAQKFANEQNNVTKIFADAQKEGAGFAERQRAIDLASRLASTAIAENSRKLGELKEKYQQLKTEREGMLEQQRQSIILEPVTTDDPLFVSMATNREEMQKTQDEMRKLQDENVGLAKAQRDLTIATKENSKTLPVQRSAFARLGTTARGVFNNIGNIAKSAFESIKNGAQGLAGFLDPLTAVFIATGIATRLYSDGNREAAQVAEKYASSLATLKQAHNELIPAQKTIQEESNYLNKAWDGLSVATVKIANAIGSKLTSAFNIASTGLSKFQLDISQLPPGIEEATKAFASFSLVAGGGVLGAAIGSFIFPGIGTAIGAVIGGSAAAIAALALSSDDAATKLERLKGKLAELKQGTASAARASQSLAQGLLKEIKITPGKEIKPEDLQRLKGGLEAIRGVVKQIETDVNALEGTKITNTENINEGLNKLDGYKAKLSQLKQQERNLLDRGPGAPGEEYIRRSQELSQVQRDIAATQRTITRTESSVNGLINQNREITSAGLPQLRARLREARTSFNELQDAVSGAEKINLDFINTLSEMGELVKALQDENQQLDLTKASDLKKLDQNLTRIKQIQAITEALGKTSVEIDIQFKEVRGEIAAAQTKIDIPPGSLRDFVSTAREVQDRIAIASATFSQSASFWANAAKEGEVSQGKASENIRLAGFSYLKSVKDGAASLADAGRDFRDKLEEATNSLSNLRISKPEFFTAAELKTSTDQINRDFEAALQKVRKQTGEVNFFPKLEGKTETEILKAKADFIETRKEADKLSESIKDITVSLEGITFLLAKIAGIPAKELKKFGLDINRLTEEARTNIEQVGIGLGNLGGASNRIGDIVGKISGGGQEFVLYFDNLTNTVETVTAAEFEALKQASKLIAAGKRIGDGFTQGSRAAVSSISAINGRVGDVVGKVSAGGKTQVLYYDNITNQIEAVDQATFDRLSKEKQITNENTRQVKTLEDAIRLNQSSAAAQFRPSAQNLAARPPVGGFNFFPENLISEANGNTKFAEIARRLGGNFLNVLRETIQTGGQGSFPLGKLSAIQDAVAAFNSAIESVNIAQAQLASAQDRYNESLSAGSTGNEILAASVTNAKEALRAANYELDVTKTNYEEASRLAKQLGIDINSVPTTGNVLQPPQDSTIQSLQQWEQTLERIRSQGMRPLQQGAPSLEGIIPGPAKINESLNEWERYVKGVQTGLSKIYNSGEQGKLGDSAQTISGQTSNTATALENGASSASNVATQLEEGATQAERIAGAINGLAGNFSVSVTYSGGRTSPPGLWTGGPVVGGHTYQVNEIGTEGFLSKSGVLSTISKPAYSNWRAPGAGAVIPAHIMEAINVPQISVNTSKPMHTPGENGMQRAVRAMLGRDTKDRSNAVLEDLVTVQASQAIQIGKLSRVVNRLAEKDWNVNVHVRPSSSTSYMNALNHKL